jgi:uncharacterized peroxidase-related enzyme
MSDYPISRYPIPKLEDLPDDIRERILAVQEKSGFIPNVFLALAHRPDEFRAFFQYNDTVMQKDSGLSKAEKEMIVVVTSAANDCTYCVISHGAILRIYSKNPIISDQIAIDYAKADITPRQKAMLDFAVKLAVSPAAVDETDYAKLEAVGFSSEDVWDIAAITSFFSLSNRMAHFAAMRPNDDFYLMGRISKNK